MKSKKTTRRALLTSMLSLLICVSMLVGSTFAWFTDSVTSQNNIIKSGNLDIEMAYSMDLQTWDDISDAADVFVAPAGVTKGLWEPGHTEVAYLRITNAGSLSLKYRLQVAPYTETVGKSADGKDIKLSEILKFVATEPSATELTAYTRETAQAAALAATNSVKLTEYTTGVVTMAPGTVQYIALVVYMPEEVGNEANYRGTDIPTIEFALNLVATQVEAQVESDSFGSDYDKDATYPLVNSANVPGGTAVEIKTGDVTVTVPAAAPAGNYSLSVESKNVSTGADGKTTVTYEINLLKDGVKVQPADGVVYTVAIDVGKSLDVSAVTHKGESTAYSYEPTTGIVTLNTASFSPFAVTYTEAGEDTVYLPSDPEAAEKLKQENVVAVDENGNSYATLTEAVKSGASKLYFKEGVDLGTITHLDVDHDLVIYGNGAYISAGERDFAIDTYKKLAGDITVTVYNLHGVAFWGQRSTEHTVTLNLYNCNDLSRIYLNGTSGTNNINLYNCTAKKDTLIGDTVVYSNANGKLVIDGCTFTGIGCPVNLNHKVAGEQTVIVTNSTFVDCSTEGTAAYYAPIRLYNSVEGANQTLTVKGNTFTYSEGKAPINGADVLLNAKHNGVDADGTIAAEVQADATVTCGQNVTLNWTVSDADELKAFAAAVNKYSNYEHPYEGQTVKLMCDINLGGMEWTPIGDYRFQANRFCGTFDGQGHTISNFKITKKTDKNDDNKSSYGFFGNVDGTIKNLTIDNAQICSYAYVGALVGRLNGGQVLNCHVKNSSVEATYWQAGGMIGQLNDGCTVKDCTITKTTVTGAAAIGGMFGPLTAANKEGAHQLLFENCKVIECAVVQKGGFGASYDVLFGAMFADIDVLANETHVNSCTAENTTVKGVETTACVTSLSGSKIYFDGVLYAPPKVVQYDKSVGFQETLNSLNSGDTLVIPAGTTITTTGSFIIPAGVTIEGGEGEAAVIRQNSSAQDNIFNCEGDVTIRNITFVANRKGYAITDNTKNHDTDGDITLIGCTFKSSDTDKDWGVYKNLNGDLTIINCTFDNFDNGICGVNNGNGSTTTITGCTFTNCNSEAIGYVISTMPATFEADVIANNTGLTADNVIGY